MAAVEGTLLASRYRVKRRLGSGAMAVVFLAEDERLGRQVAIKRLHADSPEETAERFDREARLGASLNHPNIVAVYDVASDPDGVLIVMEYVKGWTLSRAMGPQRLEPKRAFEILEGIASALDHAHRHGVIHRDVKPANVLLRTDGLVKLADLGIATATTSTRITRAGSVLGTPSYMAPEQLEGGDVTPAVDVYALAALAFELLSGRRARDGRSPMEIAHMVASRPPPDLSEAWPDAPPRLGKVLAGGMARAPAERPGSAGELVRELGRGLADVTTRRTAPASPGWVAARARAGDRERPAGWISGAAATAASTRERRSTPVVEPPRPPMAAPGAGRGRGGAWRRIVALAAVALAGAVVSAAWLVARSEPAAERSSGSAGGAAGARAPAQRGERSGTTGTTTKDGAQAGARTAGSAVPGPSGPAGTPERAVRSFYERAARDDFEGAWALAGPGFRSQLGGFDSLRGTLSTLESIRFEDARTVSRGADAATVAAETLARHPDRVERCSSTFSLSRAGAGWRLERARAKCGPAGKAGNGKSRQAKKR